jgi:hypothetical protein
MAGLFSFGRVHAFSEMRDWGKSPTHAAIPINSHPLASGALIQGESEAKRVWVNALDLRPSRGEASQARLPRNAAAARSAGNLDIGRARR